MFISVQIHAKYIPDMAKNSAAQYEVVAVDAEDGVQWRRWRWRQQRLTASKTKARRWQVKDGI